MRPPARWKRRCPGSRRPKPRRRRGRRRWTGNLAETRARSRAAQAEAEEAAEAAARQAARAETLRGVIAKIEAARRAAEAQARTEAARERRARETAAEVRAPQEALRPPARGQPTAPVVPVAGAVVQAWGDRYRGRASDRPLLPGAAAGACGLALRRAGSCSPRRSGAIGLLVIMDCGGGYHFVLAGLDRLNVSVGDAVQAGEPVGVMPAWDPAGRGDRPRLYVELRRGGQPVDPAPLAAGPWLRLWVRYEDLRLGLDG